MMLSTTEKTDKEAKKSKHPAVAAAICVDPGDNISRDDVPEVDLSLNDVKDTKPGTEQEVKDDPDTSRNKLRYYLFNHSRENNYNKWSAASSLPVYPLTSLVDQHIQPEGRSVPVFAFVTALHSALDIATNMYFLSCKGDHSRGCKWSLFLSGLTLTLAILLFFNSIALTAVAVESNGDENSTWILFLTIMQYCLQASIPLPQSVNLGYYILNNKCSEQQARTETIDLEMGTSTLNLRV